MPGPRRHISTVVFDLDDTLYDCYRQRVLAAHRYAAARMLGAGLAGHLGRLWTTSRLAALRLRLFREERNLLTLDRRFCERLGVRGREAARLARLSRRAYFSYPVRRLHLFSDARPTLRHLHALGVRVYILTAGLRRIQRAKVRVLGLDRSPYVNGIHFTGLLRGRGKDKFLRRRLRAEGNPKRILVVGDRPDSEIRAARALGLWTVRRLGGEFAHVRPRRRAERPHFTVRRLSQIFRLGFRFGAC
jgi:FMN phosphatase YigB (HAD superfamily)